MLPEKPNSVPQWAKESFAGDEKDFSEWMYSVQFWKEWEGKEEILDTSEAVQRADALAKLSTLERTFSMDGLSERAMGYQLYRAVKDGWQRWLPAEYSTVGELLSVMLEETPENTSKFRDLKYLIETVLPALEKAGVDPEKLIAIPEQWSKARVSIPAIRTAVNEMEGDDLADEIADILEKIADETISVRDLRDQIRQKRYKTRGLEPVDGGLVIGPHGDMLIIPNLPPHYVKAIQLAVEGIVGEWKIMGINEVTKMIVDEYFGKGDYENGEI